jgi:hypothetical protein
MCGYIMKISNMCIFKMQAITYISGLFNDAVTTSDYIVLNDGMIK